MRQDEFDAEFAEFVPAEELASITRMSFFDMQP